MAKPDDIPRTVTHPVWLMKNVLRPGERRKGTTMAKEEAKAARRRWLMIGAAVAAALVVGILIGRFLVPFLIP